jgi:1,4-dihydroxy-2-naphthoate octaprenyltransferase
VHNWSRIMRTCTCSKDAALDPIAKWLLVTRACVQPMTLTSGAIAGLLAARSGLFDPVLYVLSFVGIVLAHAANNMINDYFDLSEGQDTESYPRHLYSPHPVIAGIVSKSGLGRAILAVNLIDGAIMIVLAITRGWPIVAFALVGLFISVYYVAPPLRLKAHGFGEPSVFAIWGPLMIGGTYYAATGTLPVEVWWATIPYALLVTTVLMGKHIDKIPWDGPQRINTIPVLLGDRVARMSTVALMVAFYASVIALVLASVLPVWTLIIVLGLNSLRKTWIPYTKQKPKRPPDDYPLWPLWYGPLAFVHTRFAGLLLLIGLAAGAIRPVFVGS